MAWRVPRSRVAPCQLSGCGSNTDKVQIYDEAYQQIKAATGIHNIDELVQTFIDAEDQNFSLFNYVSEVSHIPVVLSLVM